MESLSYNGNSLSNGSLYDDGISWTYSGNWGTADFDIYRTTAWESTAFTQAQIELYKSGIENITTPTSRYDWDEASGSSTITDSVGGLNGTVVSGTGGGSDSIIATLTTNEDTDGDIDLSDYVSDVDGDNLTYSIDSDVSNGSTSVSGSVVTYSPTANYSGTDSFTFVANDGTVDSAAGTVNITITSINDAPTTSDGTASVTSETETTLDLSSVASDVDGDNLTYTIVSNPSNGTLSNANGSNINYTSDDDFEGTDTFTFKVNDGSADSNTSTITLTVNAPTKHLELNGNDARVEFDVDWSTFDGYTTNTSGEGAGINSSTMSIWVNLDQSNSQPIFSNVVGNNSVGTADNQWLTTDGGSTVEYKLDLNNGQTHNVQAGTLSASQWHHIVIVREKNISANEQNGDDERKGRRIYIDGSFSGSLYDSGTRTLTDLGMYLGYADAQFNVDEYLDGAIDAFAIWDTHLTPDEITEIHSQGRNYDLTSDTGDYVSSSSIKLFYNMDGNLEDQTGDSSQDGTLVNGSYVND